jgi:hypothetical protein
LKIQPEIFANPLAAGRNLCNTPLVAKRSQLVRLDPKDLVYEEVETKGFQLVSSQPSLTQDTVELKDYENFG